MLAVRNGQTTHGTAVVPVVALVAATAQVALLALLSTTVHLDPVAWTAGAATGVGAAVLLDRGLRAAGEPIGAANRVTLARAIVVGNVTALVVQSMSGPVPTALLVALGTVALVLDAVDGAVARRTGSVSALGARFDMEVDAFLILVLSVHAVDVVGAWVLVIGAARYVFVAAGAIWPWLTGPLPPRYWRKVVAAVQGIVLVVIAGQVLQPSVATALALAAGGLLLESFGRDVRWLWRRRAPALVQMRVMLVPVEPQRPFPRRGAAALLTVAACGWVWFALVGPGDAAQLSATTFLRLPVEAIAVLAVALLLPARWVRSVVLPVGIVLGILTVLRLLDLGFSVALDRAFDPLSDWAYLGPATGLLDDSIGRAGTVGALAGAAALVVAILVLTPLAALRLTSAVARHRHLGRRVVAVAAVLWSTSALVGLHTASGAPFAAAGPTDLAYEQFTRVVDGVRDADAFARTAASDPFAITPAADLLDGLRGKDVVVAFVESYGRVALQDPAIAPQVSALLDAGTADLASAGFGARSGFLTSPTFGGLSWLAHATLQSGLWIDSKLRYDELMSGDRMTLSSAFGAAGWRTVGDVPSNFRDWPEGREFYGYDQVYDAHNVGYRGPDFSYATMTDQYVLSALQRLELAGTDRPPVMAEVDLISSHTPWAPLPTLVDWAEVGDGTVFHGMPERGDRPQQVWRSNTDIKKAYGQSIRYSLSALITWTRTYGDDNLVLLVLGDHQPAAVVSGNGAVRDVPISIITRDPAVLERVAGWDWQPGLRPGAEAPVWPMDSFRDRFFRTFGS